MHWGYRLSSCLEGAVATPRRSGLLLCLSGKGLVPLPLNRLSHFLDAEVRLGGELIVSSAPERHVVYGVQAIQRESLHVMELEMMSLCAARTSFVDVCAA